MDRPQSISLITLVLAVMGSLQPLHAHPVTFADGFSAVIEGSPSWYRTAANYSPSPSYSLGISSCRVSNPGRAVTYTTADGAFLHQRWSDFDSQANLYSIVGAGVSEDARGESLALKGGLQADYETRRVYVALMAEALGGRSDSQMVRTRAGVAPYLAETDGLHTFLVLQTDFTPQGKEEWDITPLGRFFMGPFLWEIGMSIKGEPYGAAMAHWSF